MQLFQVLTFISFKKNDRIGLTKYNVVNNLRNGELN